jgi:Alpha amylase, catalytic domain
MRYFLVAVALSLTLTLSAQTTVKKIVLQGFWWDYNHNDYGLGWADYLTELAPRLSEMGVDAVWIPPFMKQNSAYSVGYAPFDHYDLGDKKQKGPLATKMGTKDELLRMIAVMHANGIEVIEDVVLNHCDGAGSGSGLGGQDENVYSVATNSGYKNFRYVCWETPAENETVANYWARKGRWSKNYTNFYPNPDNNCTTGDICTAYWGPDISFDATAYGVSTNVSGYNPAQTTGYMRNNGRDWMMWMKKQTGVDGFRWDAVKHYPTDVQEDYSWNLKYGVPAWAQGGKEMFNVGEWVGSKTELDNYVQTIQNPTGEMMMGTFDFALREFDSSTGLRGMVYGNGNFNLSLLPGAQQLKRVHYYPLDNLYVHRTVSFVNNHDTFRPTLDAAGNYTGWDVGSELSDHIEPSEPRMSTAYAVIVGMDGNPMLFFEDLFDIGYLGNRFTHDPKDVTSLPSRSDLANLVWCHQNLDFKSGAYQVPWQSGDHLILERAGKALIGITDQYSTAQQNTITSSFAQGTVLKDYSGAHGTETVTVGAAGQVVVKTVAVNPDLNTASRHGYSVWAPVGQDLDTYTPPRSPITVQEWEMANDLGDKHSQSLTQGGAIPANSTNHRVAGKIYPETGEEITVLVYPELVAQPLFVGLYDRFGQLLASTSGAGTLELTYTPTLTDWIAIKVRSADNVNLSQKCWVNASYIAPKVITDAVGNRADNVVSIWTGNGGNTSWLDPDNWEEGTAPTSGSTVILPGHVQPGPVINNNLAITNLTIEAGAILTITEGNCLTVTGELVNNGILEAGGCLINGTEEIASNLLMQRVFSLAPNPTLGSITLFANEAWPAFETLEVRVISADGRILGQFEGILPEINVILAKILDDQPAGAYQVLVRGEIVNQSLPVIKL